MNIKYIVIVGLLLFSCKSHRNVSRTVDNVSRGESLVSVVDSSQTHFETSVSILSEKTKRESSYIKEVVYDSLGNVSKTTEVINNIEVGIDLKSLVSQLKKGAFKYDGAVISSETSTLNLEELEHNKQDSRPVQGYEWFYVILGISIVVGVIYLIKKR